MRMTSVNNRMSSLPKSGRNQSGTQDPDEDRARSKDGDDHEDGYDGDSNCMIVQSDNTDIIDPVLRAAHFDFHIILITIAVVISLYPSAPIHPKSYIISTILLPTKEKH